MGSPDWPASGFTVGVAFTRLFCAMISARLGANYAAVGKEEAKMQKQRPRVLVSCCLLGDGFRYDGQSNRVDSLEARLAPYEIYRVCPETEFGMPCPRMAIDLVCVGDSVELWTRDRGRDLSESMRKLCEERVARLPDLDAAILKSGSPSCGQHNCKRSNFAGQLIDELGDGYLVEALHRQRPDLALFDEHTIQNFAEFEAELRHSFMKRTER